MCVVRPNTHRTRAITLGPVAYMAGAKNERRLGISHHTRKYYYFFLFYRVMNNGVYYLSHDESAVCTAEFEYHAFGVSYFTGHGRYDTIYAQTHTYTHTYICIVLYTDNIGNIHIRICITIGYCTGRARAHLLFGRVWSASVLLSLGYTRNRGRRRTIRK